LVNSAPRTDSKARSPYSFRGCHRTPDSTLESISVALLRCTLVELGETFDFTSVNANAKLPQQQLARIS
jgi:hypothetical protein